MRNATACKQCRETKRRCSKPTISGGACAICSQRRISCSFSCLRLNGRKRYPEPSDTPLVRDGDLILARLTRCQRTTLMEDYFARIHDRPHSIFHRPTFIEGLRNDRIEGSVILSMYALSSYLSSNDFIRRLGAEMASASRALLLANIDTPAVHRIQTAILLANIYAAERNPQAEAMFFGVANRMAQILRLHEVDENDDPVTRQVKIRVWWTLVMADYWSSAGLMIQRQLTNHSSSIPLPGSEDVFQNATPYQNNLDMSIPGLWAHMISLVRIFGRIQTLHQELIMGLNSDDMDTKVEVLAKEMDAWAFSLPTDTVLNEPNLQTHIVRDLGGPFVALHLGFHHYFTLLFFHALGSIRPDSPANSDFVQKCRGHALAFSRLLQTSRGTSGCEAIYATVGQMTVVSSSVLLHMLLFGDDREMAEARDALMVNFAALVELEKFWPSLGVVVRSLSSRSSRPCNLLEQIARLLTFQDTCLQPIYAGAHQIDQWMFRFLYEHSTWLGDRPLRSGFATISTDSSDNARLSQFREVTKGREAAMLSALDALRR